MACRSWSLIVIVLIVLFTFLTERTRWGRHVFAVGGNEEAARRAGIRVNRIKLSVFALASTLAAAGGVLAASRLLSVNQQSGSGDVLLLAIAGPVIAGTSLFGGRGFIWSALLGAIVIGSISNGMDLLGPRLGHQVHDHRRGPAAGRDDRCRDAAPATVRLSAVAPDQSYFSQPCSSSWPGPPSHVSLPDPPIKSSAPPSP